jgi:hypothetical protein
MGDGTHTKIAKALWLGWLDDLCNLPPVEDHPKDQFDVHQTQASICIQQSECTN